MAQRTLIFFANRPNTLEFVDPINIDNRLTQSLVMRRKQVAKGVRPKTLALDVLSQRSFEYKVNPTDTVSYPDSVNARVKLSGTSPAEILKCWTDLKANVDAMIAANALIGIPASINATNLVIDLA